MLLVILEMLAASVWLGGLICIAIVVREARQVLDESSQLPIIRVPGHRYGLVGTVIFARHVRRHDRRCLLPRGALDRHVRRRVVVAMRPGVVQDRAKKLIAMTSRSLRDHCVIETRSTSCRFDFLE